MGFESERIERLCKERGWSHYRLAKEMKVEANKVGNLFRVKSAPTVHTLRKVCEAFGITMSQFFLEEDDTVILDKKQMEFMRKVQLLSGDQLKRLEAFADGMLIMRKNQDGQ